MTKTKTNGRYKADALFRPFDGDTFKWPDDRTSYSGVLSSKQILTIAPTCFTGTTTNHNWGILIYPSMDVPAFELQHDGVGTLQDVNAGGTSYFNAYFPANRSTVRASPGLLRCTGMAARIVYEGTELQRAGRYIAGTMRSASTPVVVPGTGTRLSAISSLTSSGNWFALPGTLEAEMLNVTSGRVSDGIFEAVWRPSKVPQYMSMPVQDPFPINYQRPAGVNLGIGEANMLNSPVGLAGQEAEQSVLAILIEGDISAAASAQGNPYKLEIVWHWEHIPQNPLKTVLTLTPSPYDPIGLASILNRLHRMPTGRGTAFASMDQAQPFTSVAIPSSGTTMKQVRAALKKISEDPSVQAAAKGAARFAAGLASQRAPARRQRRIAN